MSEYVLSDSAFLNIATYLSENCQAAQKPSKLVPVKFMGSGQSSMIYNVGFERLLDEGESQCWRISFRVCLVVPLKTWNGILKSVDQPRNVVVLGSGGKTFYTVRDTDFTIVAYQQDTELKGDLTAFFADVESIFKFKTYGYGDIPVEIANIVERGNHVPG